MRKFLLVSVLALLTSCSTAIDDYRDQTPAFALETFFTGKLRAYGMVQDYSDKVTRRFSVELVGRWEGHEGVLEEDFYYADGETQRRVWYLTKLGDGRYSGRADDVVGTALGRVEGFALNWHYTLQVPIDGDIMEFQLDDWMYLVTENHLLNRATMKKFGLPVAEITLYIERLDD
ncbi:MAG TPA: DUF3833 domain-containing protein [Pseudomonadales bacterium]|nr:DUF3833 domain-containing protein [Pseudomonadales bacterium]